MKSSSHFLPWHTLALASCLLVGGLATGCGSSDNFVGGPGGIVQPPAPQLRTITVNQTVLPRQLPPGTSDVRLTVRDASNQVVFGPTTLPVAASVIFTDVPVTGVQAFLEYLNQGQLVGSLQVMVGPGNEVINVDNLPVLDPPGPVALLQSVNVAQASAAFFLSALNGVAVGFDGTIFRTIDGGKIWSPVPSGTTNNLNSVFFRDALNGYAVGTSPSFNILQAAVNRALVTSDGGQTWQESGDIDTSNAGLDTRTYRNNAVRFVSANLGLVAGARDNSTNANDRARVYFTQDGGANWAVVVDNNAGANAQFRGLGGTAPLAVAVGDNGRIFQSISNGTPGTWNNVGSNDNAHDWRGVAFNADNSRGYAVGSNGLVSLGTVQGSTWSAPINEAAGQQLNAVAAPSADVAVAVGQAGTIIRTINGGTTWNPVAGVPNVNYSSVRFVDANNGFAVSSNSSVVLQTTDGGATWTEVQSPASANLGGVSFGSTQVGWAVGGNQILKTLNAGLSFQPQTHALAGLVDVSAASPTLAYTVGGNTIGRTNDGGTNWTSATPTAQTLRAVAAVRNTQVAFMCGDNGEVLRTLNGGDGYGQLISGTAAQLNGVSFSNSANGIVVGNGGVIRRITNGDNANSATVVFTPQTSGTAVNLHGVSYYADGLFAAVVGDGGTVLTTGNGGITWTPRNSGTANALRRVHFSTELSGIAVGDNNTVIQTGDGGITWTPLNTGLGGATNLSGVFMNPDKSGAVVGVAGTILRLIPQP